MTTRTEPVGTAAEVRAAARAHRVAARERLLVLRAALRAALANKKARLKELVQECARERLAVRGAIFAMRQDGLASLREDVAAARKEAREQRAARLAQLRHTSESAIEAARAAIAVEREHTAHQNRITEHERRRKADLDKQHAQTLSERGSHGAKLEKLRPLFERAHSIVPLPGESRTEALWRYAKAHPDEMHDILEPKAAAAIAKMKAEIADVEQSERAPSAFELKRAARIERMRSRAVKLRTGSADAHARDRAIADRIPMGQPILVGHHSEKRHRRDLEKMRSLTSKGFELAKEAEMLERRAKFAESNTAISSDDPDAVAKLRAKLASLESQRERMRAANAVIRRGRDVVPRLVALGFSEARARQLLERDPMGRIGFPSYALQNTSSEERRLRARIRQIEARAASAPKPAETLGEASISEVDNRVRVTFPEKPPEEVRRALKAAGFRWSPSANAWQRFASSAAWFEARRVLLARLQSTTPASVAVAPVIAEATP